MGGTCLGVWCEECNVTLTTDGTVEEGPRTVSTDRGFPDRTRDVSHPSMINVPVLSFTNLEFET